MRGKGHGTRSCPYLSNEPFEKRYEGSTADRGLRVYTIGFGTTEPTEMVCTASQLGGFGGFRRFLVLDEPTLQSIADVTGGEYYRAESAGQLFEVFENLPSEVVLQKERTEISVYSALVGAVFTGMAFLLSIRWFRIV